MNNEPPEITREEYLANLAVQIVTVRETIDGANVNAPNKHQIWRDAMKQTEEGDHE